MNLTHLTDTTLLNDTQFLVKKENKITTKILHHLKEIERRRLFADLGYSSLFAYATKELGYSESAAYRRIQGARLLKDLPQIERKIETGELSLTNISQASQFFKEMKFNGPKEKEAVLSKIENSSKRECEKILLELKGNKEAPTQPEKIRRNSASTQELKFTVTDHTIEKLKELKDLLAHEKDKSMDELLNIMLDGTIAQIKKKKFKVDSKPQRPLPPAKAHSRHVPAAIKREVFQRDKGKCSNCGSTHKIQYDHQLPFALGGESSGRNLRILCFSCNQRQRIKAKL